MKNAKAYYKFWIAVLIASALISLLSGCYPMHEKEAVKWIGENKKPIFVYKHTINSMSLRTNYTLISADGVVYITHPVSMELPDTIKTVENFKCE